jgi:hypothetical protein
MKKLIIIVSLIAISARAGLIEGTNELVAVFTNSAIAITNVSWSDPDRISVATNGLGWNEASQNSFSIESIPLAIGTWWRPALEADVTIEIAPHIKPGSSNAPNLPYPARAFVRYSPDKKHWSSWWSLEQRISGKLQPIMGQFKFHEAVGRNITNFSWNITP